MKSLLVTLVLLAAQAANGGEIDDLLAKAKAGDADAQMRLGSIYVSGKGAPKNSAEAAVWFQLAAEQGNAAAQRQMARMHLAGAGVPKDDVEAFRWARLAEKQGDKPAKQILVFLSRRMTPDQVSQAEALVQELPGLPAPEPLPEGVPLVAPPLDPEAPALIPPIE